MSTARARINASPHWISRGAESGSRREASSKDRIADGGIADRKVGFRQFRIIARPRRMILRDLRCQQRQTVP